MRTWLAFAPLLLLAGASPAASPVRDEVGLFKPQTIEAVHAALAPIEGRLHVEVRVQTIKPPAAAPEQRLDALTARAREAAASPAPRGTNDILQFVVCPEWKMAAVFAAPEPFALKITPGHREAMRQHFDKLFASPDKELPLAIDAVGRDLVRLHHPELTILDHARLFSPAVIDTAAQLLHDYNGPFETRLVIETFASSEDLDKQFPPAVQTGLPSLDQRKELDRQATLRADHHRAAKLIRNATYVMIVAKPWSVTVINFPQAFDGSLTPFTLRRLSRTFGEKAGSKPDEALLDAVKQFIAAQEKMRGWDSPLKTVPALTLLGALAGAWLVLRVVRLKVAGPDRPRLYTPGLMGTLFGVPTGARVYDQLFEAERPATPLTQAPLIEEEPPAAEEALPPTYGEARDPGAGEPL